MSQEAANSITATLDLSFRMLGMGDRNFVLGAFGPTGQDIITDIPAEDAYLAVKQMVDVLATKAGHQHPEDFAVNVWADHMKAKLADKRAEGRGGWDDETLCPIDKLRREYDQKMLSDPTDYLDVAILALMLHSRSLMEARNASS